MRITRRGFRVLVPEQLTDDQEAVTSRRTDARERMSEVVEAQTR